eukprot:gene2372-12187_t
MAEVQVPTGKALTANPEFTRGTNTSHLTQAIHDICNGV